MKQNDGVADVRHWYFDERDGIERTPAQAIDPDLWDAPHPIGYEAALPTLQLSPDDLAAAAAPARGSAP